MIVSQVRVGTIFIKSSMAAYIYLKGIGKKINDNFVVADLDLGLEKSKTLALIGSNNSGKSVLLEIIAGVIDKDFGKIFFDGNEFNSKNINIRKKICYIPSYNDLIPILSVYQNLLVYLNMTKNLTRVEAKNIVQNWIDIFDLNRISSKRVSKLRSDDIRLVSLCRAFIHQPEILIMDMPTLGLDIKKQMFFWRKAQTVLKNCTIIYSSQDFNEVENFSDRISFLDNGKIRLNGTISDLMSKTKSYSHYKIILNEIVDKSLVDLFNNNSKCFHLKIEGKIIEFFSSDRENAVSLLKQALNHGMTDFKERTFNLKDIFLNQIKK